MINLFKRFSGFTHTEVSYVCSRAFLECATSKHTFQSPGARDFSTPAARAVTTQVTPRIDLSSKVCFPERTCAVDAFSSSLWSTRGRVTRDRYGSKKSRATLTVVVVLCANLREI